MYAIYGNIYHQYTPNVSIYTSTMDPMGNMILNTTVGELVLQSNLINPISPYHSFMLGDIMKIPISGYPILITSNKGSVINEYPLVNIQKTKERSTISNG